MNHPELLIVDDDTDICRQMQWALASDYAVLLAHDRTSALHLCKVEQPAVVTLDLGLPSDPGDLEAGLQTLLPRPRAERFYRKRHARVACPAPVSSTGQDLIRERASSPLARLSSRCCGNDARPQELAV